MSLHVAVGEYSQVSCILTIVPLRDTASHATLTGQDDTAHDVQMISLRLADVVAKQKRNLLALDSIVLEVFVGKKCPYILQTDRSQEMSSECLLVIRNNMRESYMALCPGLSVSFLPAELPKVSSSCSMAWPQESTAASTAFCEVSVTVMVWISLGRQAGSLRFAFVACCADGMETPSSPLTCASSEAICSSNSYLQIINSFKRIFSLSYAVAGDMRNYCGKIWHKSTNIRQSQIQSFYMTSIFGSLVLETACRVMLAQMYPHTLNKVSH